MGSSTGWATSPVSAPLRPSLTTDTTEKRMRRSVVRGRTVERRGRECPSGTGPVARFLRRLDCGPRSCGRCRLLCGRLLALMAPRPGVDCSAAEPRDRRLGAGYVPAISTLTAEWPAWEPQPSPRRAPVSLRKAIHSSDGQRRHRLAGAQSRQECDIILG